MVVKVTSKIPPWSLVIVWSISVAIVQVMFVPMATLSFCGEKLPLVIDMLGVEE